MPSNISPHVRAMIEKRVGSAQAASPAPISLKPERVQRVVPPIVSPFSTVESPAADDADDSGVESVPVEEPDVPQGRAVQADPENDNPPVSPEDGSYGYQTLVTITPARAQHLIDLNAANQRRKKESKVTQMARDMRKGLWKDRTGETIKVSASGFLIDGQNRMHAVVRSNTTIVVDVAWNVPDDRMLVIDGNSPRTTADDFKIAGVADRFVGGSLVRWVLAWEKGNPMNHGGRLTPTRSEIQQRYSQEPHSFDQAAMFGRASHHQIASVNMNAAAMAYWLFSKMDNEGPEMTEKFFDAFIGGLELSGNSPVTALRNRFISARGKDLSRSEQLALMIKAWNAFRTGRSTSASGRINVSKGQLLNENFPMPV